MKKFFAVVLSLILVCSLFSACSGNTEESGKSENGKISIVTTIFPEYDWTLNVLGDNAENAEVTMLLDNGVDLHNYQPTANDMITISNCDLFICVGGKSDKWVDEVLKSATNKDMKVIRLLDAVGASAKEEEIKEGMEAEEEDSESEEEPEYDEHVWLSLNNAETCVDSIAKALAEIDGKNESEYYVNAKAYNDELVSLETLYSDAVKNAKVKTIVFGDRFPFRYMIEDYGLDYYAAFAGCSAETEASFETISFLAGKVDELQLNHVAVIDGGDGKIAKTIVENTKNKNAKIVEFDSMQSKTSEDIKNGVTYLGVMQKNLETLKTALS